MSATRIVTVDLDASSYDIYIGEGLSFRALDFMPDEIEGRKIFIICDEAVKNTGDKLKNSLESSNPKSIFTYMIKGGEASKAFTHVENIMGWMLENAISRGSLVCAVGGGVVGDLLAINFVVLLHIQGDPLKKKKQKRSKKNKTVKKNK